MQSSKIYRKGSLGVFIKNQHVLVCKRSDKKSWQFPQGGIEESESPQEALYREMAEELGNNNFSIIKALSEPICYDFPEELSYSIAKTYKGQCLYWFLCEFKNESLPNLNKATSREFIQTDWKTPAWILNNIIKWKKSAYKQGLQKLNIFYES